MSIYISLGNQKIKKCMIFNLPTGITCAKNLLCSKYCYAKKAERVYPGVRLCRVGNYRESMLDSFVDDMITIIRKTHRKTGINKFRVHESGDFYSKNYFIKWIRIASKLPYIKFYSYTKQITHVKQFLNQVPKNLTLIHSFDGIRLKDDKFFISDFKKIAVVNLIKDSCKNKICMVSCLKCIDNKTKIIYFKKH